MRFLSLTAITLGLALAGCQAADEPAAATDGMAAEAPEAGSMAAADGADPFVGTWNAAFEGGEGGIEIAQAGQSYQVSIEVGAEGCGGAVEGPATRSGDVLTLSATFEDMPEVCEVTLTASGDQLTTSETGCAPFHGAACGFSGTATRAG